MLNLIDKVEIIDLGGISDIEGIHTRLKTLLLCAENTVPGSRAFGLPRNFVDENTNEAAAILAQELQEKCDTYIPEIMIESVAIDFDTDGRMVATISIEGGDNT